MGKEEFVLLNKNVNSNSVHQTRMDSDRCLCFAVDAEWDSVANTVTTVSATPAACTGPASNHGSATVKRAGAASSATKVHLLKMLCQHCIYRIRQ